MSLEKTKAVGSANPAALNNSQRQRHSNPVQQSWQDGESEFRDVLLHAGLYTNNPLIFDGKLHRFHIIEDRPHSKNGWYVIFRLPFLAGAFGCWKRCISQTWYSRSQSFASYQERYLIQEQLRKAQILRELEQSKMEEQAHHRANDLWQRAIPASDSHPYLLRKKVKAHSIRILNNSLVIPLYDSNRKLRTLQFINPEGNKRFLAGGRKTGCYFPIGDFVENQLLLCEGYATGASLFEAMALLTIIAFDANNLKPVAIDMRKKFPDAEMIICADNDISTKGNPGLSKGIEVAQLIGGKLAYPVFHGGEQ